MEADSTTEPIKVIDRQIKLMLLMGLKRGYFEPSDIDTLKTFLFPNGDTLEVRIVGSREQLKYFNEYDQWRKEHLDKLNEATI